MQSSRDAVSRAEHGADRADWRPRGVSSPLPPAEARAARKRVALFLPSLDGGGGERNMVELSKGLVDRGIVVDMLLARAAGPLLPLVPDGVRVIDLGSRKTVASLPGLLAYVKRQRPGAVLATLNAALVALVAKKFFVKDVRVVAAYQSTFSEETRYGSSAVKVTMKALRRLLPAADAVVTLSHGAAKNLGDCVPAVREKVHVISGCIEGPKPGVASAPLEHPWFRRSGPPVVLSVGRLVAEKGHEMLLKAFAEVRKRREARLVVLGEGPSRASLESLSRRLGLEDSVDFPGFRADPFRYIARAQVLAHASVFEGMTRVLIEALACGTPVVSTDCPHGPAEALENGKWGRLVPVGDWRGMAAALLAVLERPPAPGPLVERSRAFMTEAVAPRFEDVLFPGSGPSC